MNGAPKESQTVFSKRCFSECSEGGLNPQGQKAPKCLKTLVSSSVLYPSERVTSVASCGEETENTVWNP